MGYQGKSVVITGAASGMAWRPKLDKVREFLALDKSFDAAKQWMSDNPEACADGYGFSKQCIIVYTMAQAKELAVNNIRINCISPSPTASGFMDKLTGEGQMPEEIIGLFLPSNGRYATGAEIFMGSEMTCWELIAKTILVFCIDDLWLSMMKPRKGKDMVCVIRS